MQLVGPQPRTTESEALGWSSATCAYTSPSEDSNTL